MDNLSALGVFAKRYPMEFSGGRQEESGLFWARISTFSKMNRNAVLVGDGLAATHEEAQQQAAADLAAKLVKDLDAIQNLLAESWGLPITK